MKGEIGMVVPTDADSKKNATRGEVALFLRVGLWTKEKGITAFAFLPSQVQLLRVPGIEKSVKKRQSPLPELASKALWKALR